ncbi:MAG: MFS transporter [Gammaproteobacteria bacterium]|nr:MFS transporter [Gammaproteobacteria bacterium]
MTQPAAKFDTAYEWKAVLLLFLGFGLVGLDRWIIGPLFPAMMKDLGLGYDAQGLIGGVLAISWGVFSMLMGNLSDRFGRRKILIPALIGFSLMSGLSGVVMALPLLLLFRGVMGATEGAFLSTSVALTGEASHPRRLGFNQGIQLSSFSLFGLLLGPILATHMLQYMSWRWVFIVVALPGFILAFFMYRIIREPAHLRTTEARAEHQPLPWSQALASRNVILSMICMYGGMSCIFVLSNMVSTYLTDHVQLTTLQMGSVMAGLGVGGLAGGVAVPAVSDFLGRRPTTVLSFLCLAVSVYAFSLLGAANPFGLFLCLASAAFFGNGVLSLLTGPIATEAVPPGLTSSAIGLCSGAGELLGAGVGSILAGQVAARYGIGTIPMFTLAGLGLGLVASLFLRETAPRRVAARAAAADA